MIFITSLIYIYSSVLYLHLCHLSFYDSKFICHSEVGVWQVHHYPFLCVDVIEYSSLHVPFDLGLSSPDPIQVAARDTSAFFSCMLIHCVHTASVVSAGAWL